MSDIPFNDCTARVIALLSDPLTQKIMRADRVDEQELLVLLSSTFDRLGNGSKQIPKAGSAHATRDYRPSVGIMLLNSRNQVFVGRRRRTPGEAWQMPQGGIETGEEPLTAALRELKEEIGTSNSRVIAESGNWLFYDWPANLITDTAKSRWRGQRQKWFAMRFLGTDSDINIETEVPEFSEWKWVDISSLPALIVSFKRLVYLAVLEEFNPSLSLADPNP